MALNLTANKIAWGDLDTQQTYKDDFGQTWRQGPGGWERITGQQDNWAGLSESIWSADDPNAAKWNTGLDTSPYQQYLQYVQGSGDITLSGGYQDLANASGQMWMPSQGWLQNPIGLFDAGYNQGNRRSLNPYYNTQIRDLMRDVAGKLGLTSADADRAALQYAQQHLQQNQSGYTEATHPALVANSIASQLFQQAGRPYQGLTSEQINQYASDAGDRQKRNKELDENSWKSDGGLGGTLAFIPEVIQSNWEQALENPERLALGAADPLGTGIWNRILGQDWDPIVNEVGGPGKDPYEKSAEQGIDASGAQVIQWMVDNALKIYGGGKASAGIGTGMEASGLDPAYAPAVTGAAKGAAGSIANPNSDWNDFLESILKGAFLSGGGEAAGAAAGETAGTAVDAAATGYKLSKAYENDNYAALGGGLASVGNLAGGLNTGTLTGAAPDAGTTGGSMWDEDGNWIDTGSSEFGEANWDTADPNAGAYDDPIYDVNRAGTDAWSTSDYDVPSGSLWDSISGSLSGAGSYLQNLLRGGSGGTTGTANTGTSGLARLLGIGGSTALGIAGSKNLSNKYDNMAKRYEGFGEDYRSRLAETYRNPNAWMNSAEVQAPVQQGTNALARSLSIKGNPAGSPAAMQEIQNYATTGFADRLGKERDRLAQFGAVAPLQLAAPGAASKAADAGAGVYNAAGAGLADLTNPQPSLMDFLKQLKAQGLA